MRGGGIKNAPFGLRLLLIAAVLITGLLATACSLLSKERKAICSVDVYDNETKKNKAFTEKRLDDLCGKPVKVNTWRDVPFVFLSAGLITAITTWVISVFVVVKSSWWDCTLRGDCSGVSDIYWLTSIFGMLLMLFLIPGFVVISRNKQRTCKGAPARNCKTQNHNTTSVSLLVFSTVIIALAMVMLLIFLFFYDPNLV